jgi:ABC-type maltose transport system permease subunit
MTDNTTSKYDHLRINIDELIPTFDDMRKYYELLNGMTNNIPYFSNTVRSLKTVLQWGHVQTIYETIKSHASSSTYFLNCEIISFPLFME